MTWCMMDTWEEDGLMDGWVGEWIDVYLLGVLKCSLLCSFLKDVILMTLTIGEGTQGKVCG